MGVFDFIKKKELVKMDERLLNERLKVFTFHKPKLFAMKKNLLALFFVSIFSCNGYAQPIELVKKTIRSYMSETLGDYESYSPVSYGSIDSLFTKPLDDKIIEGVLIETLKRKKEAGLGENIPITYSISESIEKMKKESHLYKETTILNWEIYEAQRRILMSFIELFRPEFIGWEVMHKYRAKNRYGGIELFEYKFSLAKDFKSVMKVEENND